MPGRYMKLSQRILVFKLIIRNNYLIIFKNIFSNGYITIIPILLWNIIFFSKLPNLYDPQYFNSNIPLFISICENFFRAIIFILPLFFKIQLNNLIGKVGGIIYIIGSIFYYSSWLLLIYAPNLQWCKSIFGFTAPAYTIIIWLIGISLMADSYYFKISFSKWHFILPSLGMLFFHVYHTIIVYLRNN